MMGLVETLMVNLKVIMMKYLNWYFNTKLILIMETVLIKAPNNN